MLLPSLYKSSVFLLELPEDVCLSSAVAQITMWIKVIFDAEFYLSDHLLLRSQLYPRLCNQTSFGGNFKNIFFSSCFPIRSSCYHLRSVTLFTSFFAVFIHLFNSYGPVVLAFGNMVEKTQTKCTSSRKIHGS